MPRIQEKRKCGAPVVHWACWSVGDVVVVVPFEDLAVAVGGKVGIASVRRVRSHWMDGVEAQAAPLCKGCSDLAGCAAVVGGLLNSGVADLDGGRDAFVDKDRLESGEVVVGIVVEVALEVVRNCRRAVVWRVVG